MTSETLKPCPFCGEGAYVQEDSGRYYVACTSLDCGCCYGEAWDRNAIPVHQFIEEATAIQAWNTRQCPHCGPAAAAFEAQNPGIAVAVGCNVCTAQRPEHMKVVDLIREVGVDRLGAFDGCACCRFNVRNVDVRIGCGKGPERAVWISSPSLDYEDEALLRPIADEIVRQVEAMDGRGPIGVRIKCA